MLLQQNSNCSWSSQGSCRSRACKLFTCETGSSTSCGTRNMHTSATPARPSGLWQHGSCAGNLLQLQAPRVGPVSCSALPARQPDEPPCDYTELLYRSRPRQALGAQMRPLLDVVVELVQLYAAQQTGRALESVSRQEALQMLDAEQLQQDPVLYAVLNQCLQNTEVYAPSVLTMSANLWYKSRGPHAVAYVDPRCLADICFQNVVVTKRDEARFRCETQTASGAQLLKLQNVELQHWSLPCIALPDRSEATANGPVMRHALIPIEHCLCDQRPMPKTLEDQAGYPLCWWQLANSAWAYVPEFVHAHFQPPPAAAGSSSSSSLAAVTAVLSPAAARDDKSPGRASGDCWFGVESICCGFEHFVSTLQLPEEQQELLRAVTDAVGKAVLTAERTANMQLVTLQPVGSWSRGTALRDSDLDFMVGFCIDEEEAGTFPKNRREFFDAVYQQLHGAAQQAAAANGSDQLGRPLPGAPWPGAPGRSAATAASGWEEIDTSHYLSLRHPKLNIMIDIQVVRLPREMLIGWMEAGTPGYGRDLLKDLLRRASPDQYGLEKNWGLQTRVNVGWGPFYNRLTDPLSYTRDVAAQRQALLTLQMHDMIDIAADRFELPRSVIVGVILALKSWVRYGIADQLKDAALGSGVNAPIQVQREILRKVATQPPGIVLEVLVLDVLREKCETEGGPGLEVYRSPGSGKLCLLMDVLDAAANKLVPQGNYLVWQRSGLPGDIDVQSQPLITHVDFYYKLLEGMAFVERWGRPCDGPWVLHPVDPSYNCAHDQHSKFKARCWAALAAEARALHSALTAALGTVDWADLGLEDSSTRAQHQQQSAQVMAKLGLQKFPSLQHMGAWMLVRNATTLGPAIREFEPSAP